MILHSYSLSRNSLLLASTLLFAIVSHAGENIESFTVDKMQGKTCQIRPKNGDYQAAKQGESYKVGSSGKTGAGSWLTITFDKDHRFNLLPNAEVVINRETKNAKFREAGNIILGLQKGKVEVDEKSKDYSLKVQTPTAVCGAVGTSYSVETTGNTTIFSCSDGEIKAASEEDNSFATSLGEGQGITAATVPGKENSFTRISNPKGKPEVTFASGDAGKLSGGTVIEFAQEKVKNSNRPVAMRINEGGSVGDKKSGHYIIDGDEFLDASKKEDGVNLVNNYLAAAKKEADVRSKKAKETSAEEADNDDEVKKAAEDASEKRKKLLAARSEMRDAVRRGQDMMHGPGPTRVPGR
jgi:hypothetical protein